MRVPMSWLRDHVAVPAGLPSTEVADALTRVGIKVERVEPAGADLAGVVVGEVLDFTDEPQKNGKTVRWCQVATGDDEPRGIVCGARNFTVGDRVPVALPGAVLPGGFQITARKTYGHVSDGMICSARELGIGEDHTGILVLADRPAIGADVVTLLGLRDDVLDIETTPDRAYTLSIRGVAREVATALDLPFTDPAIAASPVAADGPGIGVHVDDALGCDRYLALRVTGIDPGATSPAWLQRRLTLAGMRPVSLVVDVTNHVMLDLGQPLHAFDASRLDGDITVRRARAGESFTTLDGVRRSLDATDLVIADASGPVALAGVMGGERAECGPATTDVVLEAAHFDPGSVTLTARRHRLPSEAAKRFQQGVDDALPPVAAAVAARMLVDLAGAHIAPGVTDVDRRRPRAALTMAVGLPGAVAGTAYPPEAVRRRLEQVGCTVTGDDPIAVTPPSWRPDLQQPADLVEEVVRLEGYDAVPSVLPTAPAGRGLTREQRLRRGIGRALAEAGYVEVLDYPFVGPAALDALLLPDDDARRRVVRLANPLSDDEPFLRTTLLPGLLTALLRNVGRGFGDVALFETGSVFRAASGSGAVEVPGVEGRPSDEVLAALDAVLPDQPRHVAVVLAGAVERPGWWGAGRAASWADAVEAARTVASAAGVSIEVVAAAAPPYHPGRCAELRVGGAVIGHAGELHPRVAATLGLPARTCAMELDLDALCHVDTGVVVAPPISAYPVSHRDVALVVADDVPAAAVEAALRDGAGELLESVRLFDVYTGAPVPVGHRSLAYALRFRAADRTLTDDEANAARDAAIARAAEVVGAALRG